MNYTFKSGFSLKEDRVNKNIITYLVYYDEEFIGYVDMEEKNNQKVFKNFDLFECLVTDDLKTTLYNSILNDVKGVIGVDIKNSKASEFFNSLA